MKRPAPVMSLLLAARREIRENRKELKTRARTIDHLKHERAVAKRRVEVRKKAAYELAAGNPKATDLLLMQEQREEIADHPEIEDHKRNTAPRSAP